VSAEMLVRSALQLSGVFSINASFIGITIIDVGTSLPELSVSISAAKINKGSIMIGNILGSCITNSLLVVGFAALVREFSVAQSMFRSALFAFAFVLFFALLIFYRKSLGRKHGLLLLCLYMIFVAQAYG
ncbi:MAG: sodium:calcium antiporter, partial [Candidatus Diapherotrites archaeon]|nr:sodium:calcium antiporter [Candidatus Diapherotrites archaeon]